LLERLTSLRAVIARLDRAISSRRPWILDCPVKPGNDNGKGQLNRKCASQSSGSSFTIAAPWLLPNHTVTGVVSLSM